MSNSKFQVHYSSYFEFLGSEVDNVRVKIRAIDLLSNTYRAFRGAPYSNESY